MIEMQYINPPSDGEMKMKTRPLQRHPIAPAAEVGTFPIMDNGSYSPECGHGLAQGEKKKFNRANRETVTCGRCKRTLLHRDHTDEFKRLDWIANRETAAKNEEHRQKLLDRIADMNGFLEIAHNIINSETTDGLANLWLERVSTQSAILVKVIRDKAEIDNAHPTN